MRVSTEARPRPRTKAGRGRCAGPAWARADVQRRRTANRSSSSSPIQKLGRLVPTRAKRREPPGPASGSGSAPPAAPGGGRWPPPPPRRPARQEQRRPDPAGQLPLHRLLGAVADPQLAPDELAQPQRRTAPCRGRSSPSSWRRAAIWAGSGSRFPRPRRVRSAGSPGVRGSRAHTRRVIPNRASRACPRRAATRRVTSRPPRRPDPARPRRHRRAAAVSWVTM